MELKKKRMMALHLQVLYGSGGMVDSACDHVCGVSANVSCSDGAGGEIYAHSYMYMNFDMFGFHCIMWGNVMSM